ncbi:trypsin-like serine protease [Crossiella sp. SN42]|uniref:trypsin-like serine protease n=1 Tax=Crossiella sp. SN42 TaxID=2944808 RepID=UPI00207C3A8C|nr:trypsin-like serine protease [Crossiella sp. SN42]MCO1578060.1 trypsin-like serine protease [Crossiella sp. SN42]
MDVKAAQVRRRALAVAIAAMTVVSTGLLGVGTATTAQAAVGDPVREGTDLFLARVVVGEHVRGCSGALIAPQWVLTARSCFAEPGKESDVRPGPPALLTTVTVGRNPRSGKTGHQAPVLEVVPRDDRDVALVKLAFPITDIAPVPLTATAPGDSEVLRLAGYGRTATEWVPGAPHSGTYGVTSVSGATVAVSPSTSAASICKGDAGGPALRQRGQAVELLGLVSAAWQGGCLGETETRRTATLARVDTLADWVRTTTVERPNPLAFAWRHQLHVFSRAHNGELSHWWMNRGGGVERGSWGGELAGNPAGFVDGEQQHVFGRGPDGSLRHWIWDARVPERVGQETWQGPKITGDPVAYVWKGEQHVFARAEDGSLAHWIWSGSLRNDSWGGQLVGSPAGFAHGEQQHVFARDKDSQLVHWYWDARAERLISEVWQGPKISSDPTGYLWQGQQHVFARGLNGSLEHWQWSDRFWQDNWGGQIEGRPAGFPYGEQQHAFGRGPAGELRHWYWDARTQGEVVRETWQGAQIAGDPSAHVWFDEQQVFAFTMSPDGELGHWWWENGKPVQHNTWGK